MVNATENMLIITVYNMVQRHLQFIKTVNLEELRLFPGPC